MKDFKHVRKILINQGRVLRHVGTLTQVHKSGVHDFYFEPSFKMIETVGKELDHFSFHNSGMSHIKFLDQSKDIQHSKNDSMAFEDIGCAGFFYTDFELSVLPVIDSESLGDISIDWTEDKKCCWLETNFVNSEFLLANNLGFGGVFHDSNLKSSYLGKKVIVVGATEKTKNTMLMFHYGFKESVDIEGKVKLMAIKGQFPKSHKF